MNNLRNSLIGLAAAALRDAQSPAEEVGVYDMLTVVAGAINDPAALEMMTRAKTTAGILRAADRQRIDFRDYVQGQLPLAKGSSDGNQ